jgi:hypothetical protein
MHGIHRFAAAAGAALVLTSALAATAQPIGVGRMTAARFLVATHVPPVLQGRLLSPDTCHRVRFVQSPATIFPPIYIAQTYRFRRGPCGMVVSWQPARIPIPPRARYVTVNATNGSRRVPVR